MAILLKENDSVGSIESLGISDFRQEKKLNVCILT